MKTPKICSICQAEFTEYGNNAQPINDGRCCDRCNELVIVARINILQRNSRAQKKLIPDDKCPGCGGEIVNGVTRHISERCPERN